MKALYWVVSAAVTVAGIGIMAVGDHIAAKSVGEDQTLTFESAENLDISLGSARLELKSDPRAEVITVTVRNPKRKIKAEIVPNNTLRIQEQTRRFSFISLGGNETQTEVYVVVPDETEFGQVELALGAARDSQVERITAGSFQLEMGSGRIAASQVSVADLCSLECASGSLSFSDSEIGGTAAASLASGQFTMTNTSMHSLLVESGSGTMTLEGLDIAEVFDAQIASGRYSGTGITVGGSSDLELASGGMELRDFDPGREMKLEVASGTVNLALTGKEADYSFDCETASGATYIGGNKVKDYTSKDGGKHITSEVASGKAAFTFGEQ